MPLRVSLKEIYKIYRERNALSGCTYSFEKGVYALMGPNGSGKSTLLRVASLLEPPDSGNVIYFDRETLVENNLALRRRITLVLPRPGIFNATVFYNAAYGLLIRGVDKSILKEKVNSTLNAVGLLAKKDENALTLSSGEAMRLSLARAMAIEPEVLYLDEPTAFIDEENRLIIENLILDMKKKQIPTVIIATHDKGQAERLADRIVMMERGRIAG